MAGILETVFERIGCEVPAKPSADALQALHRAYSLSVPYENIDVQLEQPVTLDAPSDLERLARERRGGWCYQLNGAFAQLLQACGFRVRVVLGAGNRETLGDAWIGSHRVLLVDLPEESWIADVGYGDGPISAVPLREHTFDSSIFHCALRRLGQGWWRYQNDSRASAPSFDFHGSDAGRAAVERMHRWLATSPDSPYVQNLVVQRWQPDGTHATLRGKVLTVIDRQCQRQQVFDGQERWIAALHQWFGIELSTAQAITLWGKVERRHASRAATRQHEQ